MVVWILLNDEFEADLSFENEVYTGRLLSFAIYYLFQGELF